MASKPKDPTDPDFPHGKPVGYYAGCGRPGGSTHPCPSTPTCRDIEIRRQKQYRWRIANGHAYRDDAAVVLRHVDTLIDHAPGVISEAAVLRTAGVSRTCLAHSRRTPGASLSRDIHKKIMAVTVEQIMAHHDLVPIADVQHVIGTMRALGYSLRWQAAKTGCRRVRDVTAHRAVPGRVYRALLALRDEYGHREATPADGLDPAGITLTKQIAAAAGFYPPAAYEDDGTLNLRLLPGHPWAVVDDDAGRCLDVLELSLSNRGLLEIAERTGIDERRVSRLRSKSGLVYNRITIGQFEYRYELTPAGRVAAQHVRRELDAYAQHFDPTLTMLRLGLMYHRNLPTGHPAVERWMREMYAAPEQIAS